MPRSVNIAAQMAAAAANIILRIFKSVLKKANQTHTLKLNKDPITHRNN